MRLQLTFSLVALLLGVTTGARAQATAPALPALGVELRGATVSGVSSGAYMALQMQLAVPERFTQGAAAVAGGPPGCAEGSVFKAIGPCLGRSSIDTASLVRQARERSSAQQAPLEPLASTRIYLFAGAKDGVVQPVTSQAAQAFYAELLPQAAVKLETGVPAGHGWVVERAGEAADCERMLAPHLRPCGFDLAGALLQHLLGPLKPRGGEGELLRFDQGPHASAQAALGEQGLLFVPAACRSERGCRVHVVLHGCQMNLDAIGDAFARGNGLNEWAASNRLVLLYPQTGSKAVNGCWDWWGYTGPQHASRDAPQIAAIGAMLQRLAEVPR